MMENRKSDTGTNDSVLQNAIIANNYASLPDSVKAKISEVQFASMVAKYAARQAVKNAIKSGDYSAFKTAMIAQIPTEAEFQKMAATEKARSDAQAQILLAVQNNDFTAYKAALATQKTALQALHPDKKDPTKAPSDTRLQKNFNRLVAYYKKNNKLPELGGVGYGDDKEVHPMPAITVEN